MEVIDISDDEGNPLRFPEVIEMYVSVFSDVFFSLLTNF